MVTSEELDALDDICFVTIDQFLRNHNLSVLDNRLLANYKGELDAIAVMRDIWLKEMQASPEKLIDVYEQTNDRKKVIHYENLVDATLINFAAELFASILGGIISGIIVAEYSENRKKIYTGIKKLYRKPIDKLNEAAGKVYEKYEKALRYIFRALILKSYTEKRQLPFDQYLHVRESIRQEVYGSSKANLSNEFEQFERCFLFNHGLLDMKDSFAQKIAFELIKNSIDTDIPSRSKTLISQTSEISPKDFDSYEVILTGLGCGKKGIAAGEVALVLSYDDCQNVKLGDVMVFHEMNPDYVEAARRSSALIAEVGGLTSHTSIIGRELMKPVIVSAENATTILRNREKIIVDSTKGVAFAQT